MSARRGRPPKPLTPEASSAAWLGAEVRARRLTGKLTQQALGGLVGYTAQYVSEVERANTPPTRPFIAACDDALNAHGALLVLLPAALEERELARQDRTAARRAAREPALGCEPHSDAGDDVEPTDRRGLIGAAGATVLAAGLSTAAPSAAREIDPELPAHLTRLLGILGCHDDAFGPREVLGVVLHELRVIAEHRQAARGDLRTQLMRVEACWSEFGSWLAHDCGDRRTRDALLDRALHLAREADYACMVAWARARLAQYSDAPTALRHAEAGLRTPRAGAHARAMCAARVAHAHARRGDAGAAGRSIAEAAHLAAMESPSLPPPYSEMTDLHVHRWEARCWAELEPARAIGMYDDILRDQPRAWVRERGLYLAYVANACAAAGELDRAKAEGAKAAAIHRRTQSSATARELTRLVQKLKAA
jgi:transcriptional regulator with XRE-family HTH domain